MLTGSRYLDAVTASISTSEFRVTLGAMLEEIEHGVVRLDALVGLGPEDLRTLGNEAQADISVRQGGVGVGASGPGIELVLAFASIPGDLLALIEIGKRIKSVIKKIQGRDKRSVTISDSGTLAAVAAASASDDLLAQLKGTRLMSVRNLSGGEPPNWNGTDTRHLWAVVFEHETQGYAWLLFMSPSGLVLSHCQVPLETYWDGSTYQHRSPEEIAGFSPIRE